MDRHHARSRSSSSAKIPSRSSTPNHKRLTVFERLYKDTGLSRVKDVTQVDYKSAAAQCSQFIANLETATTDCSVPVKTKPAIYKPSFIKKQRTFSNDSQIETFLNDPYSRASFIQNSLVQGTSAPRRDYDLRGPLHQTKAGSQLPDRPFEKTPKGENAQLTGIDFISAEPYISRLKERLKKSQVGASSIPQRSLLSMDLVNRSNCWLARRDNEIKARREEQEKAKSSASKVMKSTTTRAASKEKYSQKIQDEHSKPQLERPKSCLKLRKNEQPSKAGPKKRSLSNSYSEMHQLKKSSISFLFRDYCVSPNSAAQAHVRPQSLDVSFQNPVSRSFEKGHQKGSAENHRSVYTPLSPTKHNFSAASVVGAVQKPNRAKSPLMDYLTLDLSFCK